MYHCLSQPVRRNPCLGTEGSFCLGEVALRTPLTGLFPLLHCTAAGRWPSTTALLFSTLGCGGCAVLSADGCSTDARGGELRTVWLDSPLQGEGGAMEGVRGVTSADASGSPEGLLGPGSALACLACKAPIMGVQTSASC